MGAETYFEELLNSHALLFNDNSGTNKMAGRWKEFTDIDLVTAFVGQKRNFRYQDFPIYAPRLENAMTKLKEWRPQSLWQLQKRPYKDTLAFYAFWFAFLYGIISVANLAVAAMQLKRSYPG